MQITTILNVVSTDALRSLSAGELKTHTEQAAIEVAQSNERGAKWLGVCRAQLVNLGEAPEDTFKLVKASLVKGGMDDKRAKSATNNANGHMALAHFLLREDATTICEKRFFAVPVRDAKAIANTLRKEERTVEEFNKLPLRKGKISRKSLDAFLPAKPKAQEPVEESEESEGEGEGGQPSKADTPVERVAVAIKALRKNLPELSGKDKEVAIAALVELIG